MKKISRRSLGKKIEWLVAEEKIKSNSKIFDMLFSLVDASSKKIIIRPVSETGSGKWTSVDDKTIELTKLLDKLCIEYTKGNDAPKGGVLGTYIKITTSISGNYGVLEQLSRKISKDLVDKHTPKFTTMVLTGEVNAGAIKTSLKEALYTYIAEKEGIKWRKPKHSQFVEVYNFKHFKSTDMQKYIASYDNFKREKAALQVFLKIQEYETQPKKLQ